MTKIRNPIATMAKWLMEKSAATSETDFTYPLLGMLIGMLLGGISFCLIGYGMISDDPLLFAGGLPFAGMEIVFFYETRKASKEAV